MVRSGSNQAEEPDHRPIRQKHCYLDTRSPFVECQSDKAYKSGLPSPLKSAVATNVQPLGMVGPAAAPMSVSPDK